MKRKTTVSARAPRTLKTARTIARREVPIVDALRDRACDHLQRVVDTPIEDRDEFNPPKPVDLWAAKLLLEVVDLLQKTGSV